MTETTHVHAGGGWGVWWSRRGKDQKWSTVELHFQPATGSSIIMVIFRWPSALQRKRAEKEIEQKAGHGNKAGGKRAKRTKILLLQLQ